MLWCFWQGEMIFYHYIYIECCHSIHILLFISNIHWDSKNSGIGRVHSKQSYLKIEFKVKWVHDSVHLLSLIELFTFTKVTKVVFPFNGLWVPLYYENTSWGIRFLSKLVLLFYFIRTSLRNSKISLFYINYILTVYVHWFN